MQAVIDAYFAECDPHVVEHQFFQKMKNGQHKLKTMEKISTQVPYTMSGLAEALDMDRRTLVDYAHKDEFLPTIKKARRKVEVYVERLMLASNGVVAGVIFNAKNNFGWVDKTEQDVNVRTPQPLLAGRTPLLDQSTHKQPKSQGGDNEKET